MLHKPKHLGTVRTLRTVAIGILSLFPRMAYSESLSCACAMILFSDEEQLLELGTIG